MKKHVEDAGAATIRSGAVLAVVAASACCVGPALGALFVAISGASGLAAIAGFRPYAPVLFFLSAAMLGFAISRVISRRAACSTNDARE